MFDENFIKEQAEMLMDIQKRAFDAGYKAGFEAGKKEKEEIPELIQSPKDAPEFYE